MQGELSQLSCSLRRGGKGSVGGGIHFSECRLKLKVMNVVSRETVSGTGCGDRVHSHRIACPLGSLSLSSELDSGGCLTGGQYHLHGQSRKRLVCCGWCVNDALAQADGPLSFAYTRRSARRGYSSGG